MPNMRHMIGRLIAETTVLTSASTTQIRYSASISDLFGRVFRFQFFEESGQRSPNRLDRQSNDITHAGDVTTILKLEVSISSKL